MRKNTTFLRVPSTHQVTWLTSSLETTNLFLSSTYEIIKNGSNKKSSSSFSFKWIKLEIILLVLMLHKIYLRSNSLEKENEKMYKDNVKKTKIKQGKSRRGGRNRRLTNYSVIKKDSSSASMKDKRSVKPLLRRPKGRTYPNYLFSALYYRRLNVQNRWIFNPIWFEKSTLWKWWKCYVSQS